MKYVAAIFLSLACLLQPALLRGDDVTLDAVEEIQPESNEGVTTPADEAEYENEVQEAIEQSQAEFGTGATPDLPKPPSLVWRNIAMFLVTVVTFTLGIAAVSHNPGHSVGS